MFRMIVLTMAIAAAGFAGNAAAAETGEDAGLNGLLSAAAQNNPEIRGALKRWEASKARIPQAKSLENPSLGLRAEKIPRGTVKFDRSGAEDRMLEINQLLPLVGKLSLKGKIALVESQIAAAQYKAKSQEIANALARAYYDLFMSYTEEDLNREMLTALETAASLGQAQYVAGSLSQESVVKLTIESAQVRTRIRNITEERTATVAYINGMLNRAPDEPLERPALTEELDYAEQLDALYRRTLQNEPELLAFEYAIQKGKHAVALARRSAIPDVMAGIVQRGIFSGGLGSWDLALSFTVPLWFWSKQKYEIREAISNQEEAQAAYDAMKSKALSATRASYARARIARDKAALYRSDIIPLLEGAVNASLSAFRSGRGDALSLLDNARMLIENRMNYYRALVEYHQALADLKRQTGESYPALSGHEVKR